MSWRNSSALPSANTCTRTTTDQSSATGTVGDRTCHPTKITVIRRISIIDYLDNAHDVTLENRASCIAAFLRPQSVLKVVRVSPSDLTCTILTFIFTDLPVCSCTWVSCKTWLCPPAARPLYRRQGPSNRRPRGIIGGLPHLGRSSSLTRIIELSSLRWTAVPYKPSPGKIDPH